MATHDKSGREYARLDALNAGDVVETDGDFTCMARGGHHVVKEDGGKPQWDRLYVDCGDGRHYLTGQDDGDGHLVGMHKVLA